LHINMAFVVQATPWYLWFNQKTRHSPSHSTILLAFIYVCLMIFQVMIFARTRSNSFVRWIVLLSAFSTLIGSFSSLYWNCGISANFGTELTRFDAFYFTLGTLSTAGSGNIIATSDVSRAIQVWQMGLDLGLVLFAVGITVNKLSSIPAKKRSDVSRAPKRSGVSQQPRQAKGKRARKRARKRSAAKRATAPRIQKQKRVNQETDGVKQSGNTSQRWIARRAVHLSVSLIISQFFVWETFFSQARRSSDTSLDVLRILVLVGAIALIFASVRIRWTFLELLTIVGNSFAVLLFIFTSLYWDIGSTVNFNMKLTHVDSVYYAMGTLSTAGTGNITAISEAARTTQTWQIIFGLFLILLAAGVAVNRLSSDSLEKIGS
jgi:hypothetical protein